MKPAAFSVPADAFHFRNDIQGLRAVAFLLVFIFHLNARWLPGGFIGVDIFFVISSFLITSIALRDMEAGTFSVLRFFNKRIRRIAPVYYVVVFITMLASSVLYIHSRIPSLVSTFYHSAVFATTRVFARSTSYFGTHLSENPLLHTWSLAIEMQFYALLPFVLLFFRKYLVAVLLFLFTVCLAYSVYEIYGAGNKSVLYFSLVGRVPEFLVGALYSIWFKKGLSFGTKGNQIFAFLNAGILVASAFVINESSNFPGLLALLPCLATANLLVSGNNPISKLLSAKPLVFIGKLSYSLYLWHWPLLALIRYKQDSYDLTLTQEIGVAAATFILAWLSYVFIERPSLRAGPFRFYAVWIPAPLLLLILSFTLPMWALSPKIPAIYLHSAFGMRSHGSRQVEKMGDTTAGSAFFLTGDSHALVLKAFFDTLGKTHHFAFQTVTQSMVPPLEGIQESEIPPDRRSTFRKSAFVADVAKPYLQKSGIIIISSLGFERFPSLRNALENLAAHLSQHQKLILIHTFPVLDKHPLKVHNSFLKGNQDSFKVVSKKENALFLDSLAKKHHNVYCYDISKSRVFRKAPYFNDTLIYYDKNHINPYGALKLAADLDKDFMQFLEQVKTQ